MDTLSDRETPQPLKSLLSHSKYFFFGETTLYVAKLAINSALSKYQRWFAL